MIGRDRNWDTDMRALVVAGILGLFGLAAIFSMHDGHGGHGYHVYYLTPDGNFDMSSGQRHSQLRSR
jgi:hypothetical protein